MKGHRARKSNGGSNSNNNNGLQLLGEVVGGCNLSGNNPLPVGANPYCVVQCGSQVLHKTKKAEGGANPTWTVQTGAYFLFDTDSVTTAATAAAGSNDQQAELGVSVWYKQKDSLQLTVLETVCLGTATFSLADIELDERMEFPLTGGATTAKNGVAAAITNSSHSHHHASLALRFRLATPSDRRFLQLLDSSPSLLKQKSVSAVNTTSTAHVLDAEPTSSLLVTETNETEVAGNSFFKSISGALTSRTKYDAATKQEKFLIKPHPDPARVEQTTYMTKAEIDAETHAPSHTWIPAGSGTVGKVYLEILGCTDLPNLDVGAGNLTDAFLCVVYEDAMVQTPVIDDELSPKFLPWTPRAFLFGMLHPSSPLYLSVLDYDLGPSAHDPIGRVAVNLSNLQRDTDYTLTYDLFPSSNVTDRTAAGQVTIRVRLEYPNQKLALLAALQPRPKFHINVRKEKSLSVLRYTCFGEHGDDEAFDLTVVRSYINEILEYKRAISYCFGDALRSLVFWRGQVQVGRLLLPLHSLLFYCSASTLVERPYLTPPFMLLGVAWVMIATQTQRLQHPSPWYRCFSMRRYVEILRKEKSSVTFARIESHEGAEEGVQYEKLWRDRIEKDLELAAKQYEMQQEITKLGDETITTKQTPMGLIPLDLLERLAGYQGIIGRLCKKFRFIKIIVTWEESFLSFWITACFLVGGLVSLLLPWAFILTWTSRLFVWGVFGPHMKIVDWVLQQRGDNTGEALKLAVDNFKKESLHAHTRHQEAVKLRDMKCLAFGKYITLVPSHNLSRHHDVPLPRSFARLRNGTEGEIKMAPRGVPGQHLFGNILPKTEAETIVYEKEIAELREVATDAQSYLHSLGNNSTVFAETSTSPTKSDLRSVAEKVKGPVNTTTVATGNGFGLRQRKKTSQLSQELLHSQSTKRVTNNHGSTHPPLQPTQSWSMGDSTSRDARLFAQQLTQVDEEREAGEVEIVLSLTRPHERESFEGDELVEEDAVADAASVISESESSVVFFQPSFSSTA